LVRFLGVAAGSEITAVGDDLTLRARKDETPFFGADNDEDDVR